MKRANVFLLCLFGALLIVGAGVLLGFTPGLAQFLRGRDSARPPCGQLPDRKSVVDAVASHEDLVIRVTNVGPGVEVGVATPCEDQPDRAIVRIKYATGAERKGVDAILRQEGFGAPAELVKN